MGKGINVLAEKRKLFPFNKSKNELFKEWFFPDKLVEKIDGLNLTRKQREIAILISGFLYDHAFKPCQIPRKAITRLGYRPSDVSLVIIRLIKENFIVLVKKGHKFFGGLDGETRGSTYGIVLDFLKEIYTTFENRIGITGEQERIRQRFENIDEPLKGYLKQLTPFAWNGINALKRLHEQPAQKQAENWQRIKPFFTGKPINTSWLRGKTSGRVFTKRPNIMNIPAIYRTPDILNFWGNASQVYSIDYTAQHLHLLMFLHNKKPDPAVWKILADKTGIATDIIKGIVNPAISGKTRGNYIHELIKTGQDSDRKVQEYDKVISAVSDLLGVDFKAVSSKKTGNDLMIKGAEIMLKIIEKLVSAGINSFLPIFDETYIAVEHENIENVTAIFGESSKEISGEKIPSKTVEISKPLTMRQP